jgi:hypothetical protein
MSITDEDREAAIDILTQLTIGSTGNGLRRIFCAFRDQLIRERSPEQVERLEREKGLRRVA